MEGGARAASLPDILVDATGGNVNYVITALCVAEAIALTGAIVGGQSKCWTFFKILFKNILAESFVTSLRVRDF